jgi:hypothetical protein
VSLNPIIGVPGVVAGWTGEQEESASGLGQEERQARSRI